MMNKFFKIGEKKIGMNNPTFIIAEVGQAHEGSLGFAHSYIDAAAEAGVDAIKFQTHFASEESSKYDQLIFRMYVCRVTNLTGSSCTRFRKAEFLKKASEKER
jgi:sialic acid synthase SpsE